MYLEIVWINLHACNTDNKHNFQNYENYLS